MALPAIWQLSGYVMALFLAGFRGIPEELREAARIDGASRRTSSTGTCSSRSCHPVALSALIIIGHMSMKMFDLIMSISGAPTTRPRCRRSTCGPCCYSHNYAKAAAISRRSCSARGGPGDRPLPRLAPTGAERRLMTHRDRRTRTSRSGRAAAPHRPGTRSRSGRWPSHRSCATSLLLFFVLDRADAGVRPARDQLQGGRRRRRRHRPGPCRTTWTSAAGRRRGSRSWPPLLRTFELAIPVALISSFLGSMNGFVLSRWRFPGADVVFTLILFGMFIPYQAVMIPLVQLVRGPRVCQRHPHADRRARDLRHPDLHADLPQLLRNRSPTS